MSIRILATLGLGWGGVLAAPSPPIGVMGGAIVTSPHTAASAQQAASAGEVALIIATALLIVVAVLALVHYKCKGRS